MFRCPVNTPWANQRTRKVASVAAGVARSAPTVDAEPAREVDIEAFYARAKFRAGRKRRRSMGLRVVGAQGASALPQMPPRNESGVGPQHRQCRPRRRSRQRHPRPNPTDACMREVAPHRSRSPRATPGTEDTQLPGIASISARTSQDRASPRQVATYQAPFKHWRLCERSRVVRRRAYPRGRRA